MIIIIKKKSQLDKNKVKFRHLYVCLLHPEDITGGTARALPGAGGHAEGMFSRAWMVS